MYCILSYGEQINTNKIDNAATLSPVFSETSIPGDKRTAYCKVAVSSHCDHLPPLLHNEEAYENV